MASSTINVVEPHLDVASQPTTSVTAGVAFPLTVNADDYLGTPDPDVTGTVVTLTILSGPTGATFAAGSTLTAPSPAASQPSAT